MCVFAQSTWWDVVVHTCVLFMISVDKIRVRGRKSRSWKNERWVDVTLGLWRCDVISTSFQPLVSLWLSVIMMCWWNVFTLWHWRVFWWLSAFSLIWHWCIFWWLSAFLVMWHWHVFWWLSAFSVMWHWCVFWCLLFQWCDIEVYSDVCCFSDVQVLWWSVFVYLCDKSWSCV